MIPGVTHSAVAGRAIGSIHDNGFKAMMLGEKRLELMAAATQPGANLAAIARADLMAEQEGFMVALQRDVGYARLGASRRRKP